MHLLHAMTSGKRVIDQDCLAHELTGRIRKGVTSGKGEVEHG
jgi:hypothetical protein